jgi:hypothetical protein
VALPRKDIRAARRAARRDDGAAPGAPAAVGEPFARLGDKLALRDEEAAAAQAQEQRQADAATAERERQARIAAEADPRPQSSSRDVFGGGFLNPGKAAQEKYDANEATDERYGGEFSWLDPSFQRQAELLGTAERANADPNAIAQQSDAMNRARELANDNLDFSDPALQQALGGEWAKIQGGAGAPQFGGDADQRRVLEQALGFSSNQGPGSLVFDDGSRQREQYGNLQGIIAGGGATAIEMADRARQRGDSEAWLRGQREADMANYAERGLTGSGMELLNLSADRQAAAQRNSLGDLETAKALEERRLATINNAAGLAGTMRGQTIDEQALLNQRTTTGLGTASSVANAMRGADYNEKTYLDKRGLDALSARTDLQNKMRDQTYQEQIGNRNAQQSALDSWRSTAGQARDQSAQESQYNATRANDWSELNTSAINKAKTDNTSFLQDQYDATQVRKQQRWQEMLRQNTDASGKLLDADQRDNIVGSGQGTQVGTADTKAVNDAIAAYRDGKISASDLTGILAASKARNDKTGNAGQIVGGLVDIGASVVTGGGVGGGITSGTSGGLVDYDAYGEKDQFSDEKYDSLGTSDLSSSNFALTAKAPTSALPTSTASPWRPNSRRNTASTGTGTAYDPERIRKAMGY